MHTPRCIRAFDAHVADDIHGTTPKVRRNLRLRIVQLYLQHAVFKIGTISRRDGGWQIRIICVISDVYKVSIWRIEVVVEQLPGKRWVCK